MKSLPFNQNPHSVQAASHFLSLQYTDTHSSVPQPPCLSSPEHEGPVSLVSVSDDGLSVMAATTSGNLGYLDVSSRGYSTLMRSHTDGVLGFSLDGIRRRITTASCDRTVRVWDMDSMQQVGTRALELIAHTDAQIY